MLQSRGKLESYLIYTAVSDNEYVMHSDNWVGEMAIGYRRMWLPSGRDRYTLHCITL